MNRSWKLPTQTCPDINAMIRTIEHLEGHELERGGVNNIRDQLEDLRASNAQLRGIAEEAIDTVTELEQKISEMDDELAVAADKISQLEEHIDRISEKELNACLITGF